MSEIVSPESKLYVKEEVEKAKKEIKEDIEKANSKAARTFTIVGVVLGILTGVGVYGLAANYVKIAIRDGLTETAIINLESDAKDILRGLKVINTEAGGIKNELGEIAEIKKIANLPIGTIVPSMLEPAEFAEAVGDPDGARGDWVLADGQKDVTNSRYGQLSGNTTPPDLRGMFLRGVNEGRKDSEKDPDDRKSGDYQRDALQEHGHVTTAKKLKWGKRDEVPTANDLGYTTAGDAHAPPASVTKVIAANPAKNETRPKNVAVYFYIKIN